MEINWKNFMYSKLELRARFLGSLVIWAVVFLTMVTLTLYISGAEVITYKLLPIYSCFGIEPSK